MGKQTSVSKAILLAGFTAGCLDILAAIVIYVYIMNVVPSPARLLQGIAKGAFGLSAFQGGNSMALAGLCFHFIIAFSFTIFYFLIFPSVPFLRKQRIIGGLLYGIFVWCVMNLLVLPALHISSIPTNWKGIARGAAILMVCVGLPVSLIISRYYASRRNG
ncbi:MAG TPA: hypothetical protein VGI82_12960 [Chitinophagaceae bacterium]|jgi:uncharacterized membrane protein YagU involved in acid resistance